MNIFAGERVDYLPNKVQKIIQSKDVFSFSIDAVLLAAFAYVPIQKGKIIDLCAGNGVIPLLLSRRSKAMIYGVEIQERLYDLASRSIELNQLQDRVKMVCADINRLPKEITAQQYDLVTCNPPYFKVNKQSEQHTNRHYNIARHELYCTLEDVVRISSMLVREKGKVALVHRPERVPEMFEQMKKYGIEPKRIQFIHPTKDKQANIVLLEGIKGGRPGLLCLPSIQVYQQDRTYTKEFKEMYYG